MINILKLRDGRRISRAEYELAKSEYQEAYQNADEATRATLDGLMRSSQNYSSADPMNNRSAREYATQMYRNAVKVANGEYSEPLGATASTKNVFNGYSHAENQNNANWLTSKYLNQRTKGKSGYSSTSTTSSGQTYYNFKWADGLGTSYGLDTDTFQDRYGRFVDNLIKNVNNAITAKQSGKVIRGLSLQDSDQLEAILQGLIDLKERAAGLQQNDALKELLKFAGPLKIDENGFKSYFSAYLPLQTQSLKNKQARLNEGYQFGSTASGNIALDDAIRSKGWSIGQLGNKRYIFDSDFNLVTTPEFFVDDDYSSQGYNQYYNIGADGSLNIGNTDEIIDQNHPYYQNYQSFLTRAKERNGAVYGVNGVWDNLNSQSDNKLLKAISQEIHGKKWIDVGRYFTGDQSVIAVPKDGQTVKTDRYGNLKFDNLDIYYIGTDNQVHKGTKVEASQALGGFNRLGYDQDPFISAENYNLEDQQSNIDYNTNYSGRSNLSNLWANWIAGLNINGDWSGVWNNVRNIVNENQRHLLFSGNISDNPEDWAKLVLNSIATDTNKDFLARFNYQSDPMSLAVILNKIIQETRMELTPEQKEAYQMLLRRAKSKQAISTEKEGGVLKAAEGNTLNIFGEPSTASATRKKWNKRLAEADAVAQRAAERGVSDSVQAASEKQGMTSSDWARVAALTMDIGSTIAAISQAGTGLFGTATSDALALGSMGVDLVADITDPSVTAGEAAKNAVINTGLGLVGFAGGGLAKLGRNLPKIAKIVTKVVAYGGAALTAMNPEIQASVKKVMESGKAGQTPMTTKDWQNVMMFLRAASGTTRGIAARAGQVKQTRRINTKAESKGNPKIEATESVIEPNQEYIKVGKKQIKVTKAEKAKLEEALASKENPQAKFEEVLKTIKGAENLTPEEISSIDTSKGKLFGLIKPKVVTEGGQKSITQRVRDKVSNTAGGISDKIAGTYATEASDAQLASLMERADARAAAAKRSPETLSWTQRLLMKSDAALGRGYTAEQIALARAANEGERYFVGKNIDLENSDKTNGTTENFRQKLQARAEAKASAETEAAKTKQNANEAAVGTPERVKLKKEEVKDVADKVNILVSKRISKSGKYKGNNKLASKEFTELKNLHEDLAELAADPDVSSNPELMAKVRAAQQALESAKIQFSGARSEWWHQFGFKQGGEIHSKYSHLRK